MDAMELKRFMLGAAMLGTAVMGTSLA